MNAVGKDLMHMGGRTEESRLVYLWIFKIKVTIANYYKNLQGKNYIFYMVCVKPPHIIIS